MQKITITLKSFLKAAVLAGCWAAILTLFTACGPSEDLARSITQMRHLGLQENEDLQKMVARRATKEVRKLKKQDYFVEPMALPMDAQLAKVYAYESAMNADGLPLYFLERASTKTRSKSAGKQHAIEVAKIFLAGRFASRIAGLAITDLSNNELSQEEAKSISKVVSTYDNWIAKKLGPVIPLAVLYREEENGILEVNVTVAYNIEANLENLREQTLSQLEKDTQIARERLEKAFPAERLLPTEPLN